MTAGIAIFYKKLSAFSLNIRSGRKFAVLSARMAVQNSHRILHSYFSKSSLWFVMSYGTAPSLCIFYLWLFNIIPEVGAILLSTHQLNKYRKFFIYCELQFILVWEV